jgi:hypothetical protein
MLPVEAGDARQLSLLVTSKSPIPAQHVLRALATGGNRPAIWDASEERAYQHSHADSWGST